MPLPQTGSPEYKLWQFMLDYQEEHKGIPPTMEEMKEACEMNFRSSVKYALDQLVGLRVVEIIFPSGQSRRYRALVQPKSLDLWRESPFENLSTDIHAVSEAPE